MVNLYHYHANTGQLVTNIVGKKMSKLVLIKKLLGILVFYILLSLILTMDNFEKNIIFKKISNIIHDNVSFFSFFNLKIKD